MQNTASGDIQMGHFQAGGGYGKSSYLIQYLSNGNKTLQNYCQIDILLKSRNSKIIGLSLGHSPLTISGKPLFYLRKCLGTSQE